MGWGGTFEVKNDFYFLLGPPHNLILYFCMAKTGKLKLEDLTKSNIWTVSEAELNQMLIDGKKKEGFADNEMHYMNIIHSVFDIQYFNRDNENLKQKLESEQYVFFPAPNEGESNAIAIRKRKINKITDLTLENINHLLPEEVLELIKNNMGTGWQGLPLAIQDIIESAFYVDVQLLPEYAMHRKGGIIERRKNDGYEVVEIERGTWIEGIFIKPKPKVEKVRFSFNDSLFNAENKGREEDEDADDEDDFDNNNDEIDDDKDEVDDVVENVPDIEDIDVIDSSDDEEE